MTGAPGASRNPSPRRRSKNERRIDQILADIPRQRETLLAAMAEFGEDFDLDAFLAAAASEDARERSKVWAVERGLEILQNHSAELATRGLNEAQRLGAVEKKPGYPFERLRDLDVIPSETCRRLTELQGVRDATQHGYPVSFELVHEAARILLDELSGFADRYERWLDQIQPN